MFKWYDVLLALVITIVSLQDARAVYCAAQCSKFSSFCANSTQWCGSSGTSISGNASYTYCMPLQGDIAAPTSSTWIVCFDNKSSCDKRNWVASGADKEYSAGLQCTAVGTARPVGPANRWRCARGYYSQSGSTNIAGSAASAIICVACPNSGTTTSSGSTKITQCYLPANTTFSDTNGSGKYTANCWYSN